MNITGVLYHRNSRFASVLTKFLFASPWKGRRPAEPEGFRKKTTVRPRPKEGFSQNLPLRERRPAERRDGRGAPWAEIVCVFLTVSARYAPPQSGLRPASSPVWEAFGPAENLRLHSAQRVDGVQVCGLGGGQQAEDHADEGGEHHGDDDCRGTDGHGNLHQAGN